MWGVQYIGSGIFYPRGVSISAPSAGLDIICCNSAGGIIDLSAGSGHCSHHLAAAAASSLDSALFLQIDKSCFPFQKSNNITAILHTQTHPEDTKQLLNQKQDANTGALYVQKYMDGAGCLPSVSTT